MAALCMTPLPLFAEITPSPLFSDNMVLLRDTRVPVWGMAAPDEEITVSFGGQSHKTRADKNGNWHLSLDPMKANLAPGDMEIRGGAGEKSLKLIKNILVGEVWLAAGQSNMEYALPMVSHATAEIAGARYPEIRFFHVENGLAGEPAKEVKGTWKVCSPETSPFFSATAYFFARDLQKAIHLPVGIIQNSVGGTLAEAWMSNEALRTDPDFAPILQRYQEALAAYPGKLAVFRKSQGNDVTIFIGQLMDRLTAFRKSLGDDGKTARKEPHQAPQPPPDPSKQNSRPSGLYNGRVAPLAPYAIRGVIWWQGEFNSERGEQYRKLFPALIHDWRSLWQNGNLPFLFVQLQNLDIQPQPNLAHYDELRDAQLMTLKTVPHTGMAVACDVGDPHDIHPAHKQPVGARLALAARALAYGEQIEYSGPIYREHEIKDGTVRIRFDHVGGGLVSWGGLPLTGFEICGSDKKFAPAKASINGNHLVVSREGIKEPIAVRYAWSDNPTCSLFNKDGLPASPFRTDDWPIHSTGKN